VRMVNNAANAISRALGGLSESSLAGKINKLKKKSDDGFYLARQLPTVPNAKPAAGVSQNYTAAGNVIPLVGLHDGSAYFGNPADGADAFIQHHATTYRRLLETMYGYPATTEDTPGLVEPPVISTTN